jgi:hypothetical protein
MMVYFPVHLLVTAMALRNLDSSSSFQVLSKSSTNLFSSAPSALDRRNFGCAVVATTAWMGLVTSSSSFILPAQAFDGSGASASSGYNPTTRAERVKGWKQRVIADVQDFNRLGAALRNGQVGDSSKEWISFFIRFQRREPDDVGRTYGALVDLRGLPTKKKYEYEGGDGLLLANSFTKPGKPPETTPAVKAWNKLFKQFDAIEAAGKKGDASAALVEWDKTKPLLEDYLNSVELPNSLSDKAYN